MLATQDQAGSARLRLALEMLAWSLASGLPWQTDYDFRSPIEVICSASGSIQGRLPLHHKASILWLRLPLATLAFGANQFS